MKYFKRYSSLLLAAVLSLSVFSLQVSAANSPIGFTLANRFTSSTISSAQMTQIGFSDFVLPSNSSDITYVGHGYFYGSADNYAVAQIRLQRQDSSTLVDVGSYDISYEGVFFRNHDQIYDVEQVIYYIDYMDGTHQDYFASEDTSLQYYSTGSSNPGTIWKVSNLFEFEKPVRYIYIRIYWRLPEPTDNYDDYRIGYGSTSITIDNVTWLDKIISSISSSVKNTYNKVVVGFSNVGSLLGTVRDKLTTLTSTLLTPLETIRDKLTTLTSTLLAPLNTIRDKIGETVTNIINLPGKIWEGLQNALWGIIVPDWYQGTYSSQNNNLFWPTPEEMSDIVTAFDDLFGEVLGPLWNIPETVLMKYYNTFVIDMPTADTYLDVPEISLEIVGERLVFGPYRIPLVPEGLASMADITKVLSAIICTFGFVSMVAHKIHSILKR